jgi:hypothetical protein
VPGRSVFAFLGQRQVVLASPYPLAECGRRLEVVTGRPLVGSFSGSPLQGRVSPDLIRVVRRQPFNSRNSLVAWFCGRIELAPDGGTLVAGTVGPHPAAQMTFAGVSLVWPLVIGGLVAGGLSSLASGHPVLPLLLLPIVFAAVYVLIFVIGPPRVRNEIQELLDELNTILDSKATFPGA